jgi:hypothetical protein
VICQLLNSTPLGEVINQSHLRQHRTSVGLRIGDGKVVNLARYAAWLVEMRHAPKSPPKHSAPVIFEIEEAAKGAAAAACELQGDGQKLTKKQELVIAALLSEPTYSAAAIKAGVSERTIYRWLLTGAFQAAYRHARRQLLDSMIGRIQAAAGQAVSTLIEIAVKGRRDGDRVRAAVAILVHSERMLPGDDLPTAFGPLKPGTPIDTAEVVQTLGYRDLRAGQLQGSKRLQSFQILQARISDLTLGKSENGQSVDAREVLQAGIGHLCVVQP